MHRAARDVTGMDLLSPPGPQLWRPCRPKLHEDTVQRHRTVRPMAVGGFEEYVGWLRSIVPEAFVILLEGSHARGEAQPGSDIDLRVITGDDAEYQGYARFEPLPEAGLRHISAFVTPLAEWISERSAPADWAWGLPAVQEAAVLWTHPCAPQEATTPPPYRHPPRRSSLQNLVEYGTKVGRAHRAGDTVGLAVFTRELAREAASLLRQLNPPASARHPSEALRMVLEYEVAPPGYRGDMEVLVGVRPAASATDRANAASSLALGTMDLLAVHLPDIEVGRPDLRPWLGDGTLQRYLAQHLPSG